MSPLPLSAPLVSTVTGGACVLAVAADPDEHETIAAHSAAVPSAAATPNFTRTSQTIRRPAGNSPSRPITSNSPRRSRHATTSYRWSGERACRDDRGAPVTASIRRFTRSRERLLRAIHLDPNPPTRSSPSHRQGRAGGRPPAFDSARYKERSTVERCFSKLRQFRAVATRYDKRDFMYQATVDVASIRI
jgi:transposase